MEIIAEKGKTFHAGYRWVHFALRNTDIMTALCKAPLVLSAVDDRHFVGRVFGVRVHLEVLGDQDPKLHGEIHIVADVQMPLKLGATHTVVHYRYDFVDEKKTAVDLQFRLRTRGLIMAVYAGFLKRRIGKYLSRIMTDNESAAMALQADDSSIREVLSEEQIERIAHYRAEHGDASASVRPGGEAEDTSPLDRGKRPWERELTELNELYSRFAGKIQELETEIERMRDETDSVHTLLTARRMLEVIVTSLCRVGLNRPRGNEPLPGVLGKLAKAGHAPDYVVASMLNLNRLCVFGAHPKAFSPLQVKEALMALCTVVEWYAISTQVSGGLATATEDPQATIQYRRLVEGVLVDGQIVEAERRFLERKRAELGLDRDGAARIEEEVQVASQESPVPADTQFRRLVEGVLVDGRIDEAERCFLDRKRAELGLDADEAARIEREVHGVSQGNSDDSTG